MDRRFFVAALARRTLTRLAALATLSRNAGEGYSVDRHSAE